MYWGPKFVEALREEIQNEKSKIFSSMFKPAQSAPTAYPRTERLLDNPSDVRIAAKRMRREAKDLPDDIVLNALKRVNDPNYQNHTNVRTSIWWCMLCATKLPRQRRSDGRSSSMSLATLSTIKSPNCRSGDCWTWITSSRTGWHGCPSSTSPSRCLTANTRRWRHQVQQQEVQKKHPGLTCFKEGFRRTIPFEAIPGLRELGWKMPSRNTPKHLRYFEENNGPEMLARQFNNLLTLVKNHVCSWPFLKPVAVVKVPDYYDHIKYPMELKTIGERIKNR